MVCSAQYELRLGHPLCDPNCTGLHLPITSRIQRFCRRCQLDLPLSTDHQLTPRRMRTLAEVSKTFPAHFEQEGGVCHQPERPICNRTMTVLISSQALELILRLMKDAAANAK